MRLLTLSDALRDAGVDVVEVKGWRTRGYEFAAKPKVVVGHHTASAKGSPMPSLNILVNGRSDLRGPLCQIGLSRDAVAYVIASGKANHAGPGEWKHVTSSSLTVGIEAENNGVGEPWPAKQLEAYDLCAAVLLDLLDQPASMYCGHKEWAIPTGRKIDPHGIDLDQQRGRIKRLLTEGLDMALSDADVDRIAQAVAVAKVDNDLTLRLAIRRIERRSEKLVDMVDALASGDVSNAKKIAVAVREELGSATWRLT